VVESAFESESEDEMARLLSELEQMPDDMARDLLNTERA
jgi:hypothetical protein